MTTAQLIQVATQIVFVLIFVIVLRRALIKPRRVSIDTALFFGAAALVLNLSWILSVGHISTNRVLQIAAIAIVLALPYFFLRLLADYAHVTSWLMRSAEVAFVVAVVVLSTAPKALLPSATAYIVVYFVGLELYAGIRFAALGMRSVGMNRRRMLGVALGTILLGVAVGVAGVALFVPALASALGSATNGLALLSGLAYFVGFSPPRWLRRFWQEPQIRAFVLRGAALAGDDNLDKTLTGLERGATEAVGAGFAAIRLWESERSAIVFRSHPAEVPIEGSLSGQVFQSQQAQFVVRRNFPTATMPLILSSEAAKAADLMMPQVTGFDVVEALRVDEDTRDIPIMVLTAKELTLEDKRALNGHVAAVFQRQSVANADLVEWLRALVSMRRTPVPLGA